MQSLFRWLNNATAKTYNGSGLAEPFILSAYQRSRALGYIQKGNVLGAVRFLYNTGLTHHQTRYFIAEEMNIFYFVTKVLDDWKPDVSDSKQIHIAQRMEAVNRIAVEWNQKRSAEKSAAENNEPTDGDLA